MRTIFKVVLDCVFCSVSSLNFRIGVHTYQYVKFFAFLHLDYTTPLSNIQGLFRNRMSTITENIDRDVSRIVRRCDGTVSEDLQWRHFPIVVGSNPTNIFIFIPLYIFMTKSILTFIKLHLIDKQCISNIVPDKKICFHTYSLHCFVIKLILSRK